MKNYTKAVITFYEGDEADLDNQIQINAPILDTSELEKDWTVKLTGQPIDDGSAVILGTLDLSK